MIINSEIILKTKATIAESKIQLEPKDGQFTYWRRINNGKLCLQRTEMERWLR